MKYLIIRISLLFIMIIMVSCSKDDNTLIVPEGEEILIPSLTSINPASGPKNTVVTINGNNFGDDLDKVEVYFNDAKAIVQSVTDTEIVVIVPQIPTFGIAPENVAIVIDGLLYEGPEFTYTYLGLVSTLAGSTVGNDDGSLAQARFNKPMGVTMDDQGNIYIADKTNHKIRKLKPNGTIVTLAGTIQGDEEGPINTAKFNHPRAVAVDNSGIVYIADAQNHKIKKITNLGLVVTLAGSTEGYQDGQGSDAQFNFPEDIAVDGQGNVYVADGYNNRIRKITPNGTVTTLAGGDEGSTDGMGTSARFYYPSGVALDTEGNLYVADQGNYKIRKITPDGLVSTLAGSKYGYEDGLAFNARFAYPNKIAVDVNANLYVTDHLNYKVRKITPEGFVSTLAGSEKGFSDGAGTNAQFDGLYGIVVSTEGEVFVGDATNNRIRKITQE